MPQSHINASPIRSELASLEYHTVEVAEICRLFSVSANAGLDTEQAKRRLATNGPNKLSPPPRNLLKK